MIKRKIFFVVLLSIFVCDLGFAQTISAPPTINDQYAKKIGNLRLSQSTINFGKVLTNETRQDTIRILNAGKVAMNLDVHGTNNYSSVSVSKNKLAPEESGTIIISYNFAKRDDYGFILDRILINTNDTDQPQKNINVSATIQEYFSPTDSLLPKARIPETIFSYGSITAGQKSNHDFLISNDGVKPLIIRKVKSTCGCIKASATKSEIAPGETGIVHVEFDSFGKEGKDSRTINVFLNDPVMAEVKLEMSGVVLK